MKKKGSFPKCHSAQVGWNIVIPAGKAVIPYERRDHSTGHRLYPVPTLVPSLLCDRGRLRPLRQNPPPHRHRNPRRRLPCYGNVNVIYTRHHSRGYHHRHPRRRHHYHCNFIDVFIILMLVSGHQNSPTPPPAPV